jgi:hypothetical protein
MATAKKTRAPAKAGRSSPSLPPPPDFAALIALARAKAFADVQPDRAFAHFRPLAEKVSTEALAVFNGQPLVMRANVLSALDAVEPHLPAALAKLADAPLQEVFELPALVMALEYANGRVPVATLSAGDIEKMLAEGSPWRALALKYLEVVSDPLLDLVPQGRVRAIRAGNGKLDKAQDFIAIHGLFNEYTDALAHRHPFPADKLDRLATLGAALLQSLKPGNAPTAATKRSPESVLRDQFAALVADRYDQLQVLASVALGHRRANELLPALRSTVTTVSDAEPATPTEGEAKPA